MNTSHGTWPDDALGDLLCDEPFLRRLALRLVRDPATADDLVQDTWVEALRRRPTPGEGLRGWSETVLRRLAGKRNRGARRREWREAHAARDEVQPDTLDEVERRLDAQTTLVAALRRISPEQREALVLRHSHELPLAEIALRQRTSVANVKARLVRGLAALRAELEPTRRRESALAVLLAPLLRPKPDVSCVAPLVVPTIGGLFALAHLIKIGAAVVAVATLVFVSLRAGGTLEQDSNAQAPERDVALSDVPHADPRETAPQSDPASILTTRIEVPGAATATAAPFAEPRDLVVRIESARPLQARVTVNEASAGGVEDGPVRADVQVEVPGVLRLALAELNVPLEGGVAPRALRVRANAEGCGFVSGLVPLDENVSAQDLTLTLTLPETAFLTGRFEGLPGTRVLLQVFSLVDGVPSEELIAHGSVAVDGSFRIGVEHAGPVALALPVPDMRPWSSVVTLVPGRTLDLGHIELEPGARISGEVRAGTEPAPGSRVRFDLARPGIRVACFPVQGHESLLWENQSFATASVTVAADDAGRFSVGGLDPGLHHVTLRPEGRKSAAWGNTAPATDVHVPAEGIVLEADWAHLELTFDIPEDLLDIGKLYTGEPGRTPQGSALSSSRLRKDPVLRIALRPGIATEVRVEFAGCESESVEARATRAGEIVRRTVVVRRPSGSIRLILTVTGIAGHDFLPMLLLDSGATNSSDPGTVLLPAGQPLRSAALSGTITFDGVLGGKRTMRLVPGPSANERVDDFADALLELDLPWSGEHRATVALERGCRLHVRVLDQDGTPIDARARIVASGGSDQPALFVTRPSQHARTTSTTKITADEGTDGWNDVVPNLPPGNYVLHVDVEGRTRREVRFQLERGVPNDVTVQL